MRAYHGTSLGNVVSIEKEGFRVGTYFAFKKEDAVAFGGPYVFVVEIPNDWKPMGVSDGWQFHIRDPLPATNIVTLEVTNNES